MPDIDWLNRQEGGGVSNREKWLGDLEQAEYDQAYNTKPERAPGHWAAFKEGIAEDYPGENPWWALAKETGKRGLKKLLPSPKEKSEGRIPYLWGHSLDINDFMGERQQSTSPDSGWVPVNPNEGRSRIPDDWLDYNRRPSLIIMKRAMNMVHMLKKVGIYVNINVVVK
jgi:hypothetical protein